MSFSIADATVKTPYIDHILAIVRAKDVLESVIWKVLLRQPASRCQEPGTGRFAQEQRKHCRR